MSARCYLAEFMQANKITASELAARLGCKPQFVYRMKRYPQALKPQEMVIIADALGVHVGELYRKPK